MVVSELYKIFRTFQRRFRNFSGITEFVPEKPNGLTNGLKSLDLTWLSPQNLLLTWNLLQILRPAAGAPPEETNRPVRIVATTDSSSLTNAMVLEAFYSKGSSTWFKFNKFIWLVTKISRDVNGSRMDKKVIFLEYSLQNCFLSTLSEISWPLPQLWGERGTDKGWAIQSQAAPSLLIDSSFLFD